jgi:hypothetical protein
MRMLVVSGSYQNYPNEALSKLGEKSLKGGMKYRVGGGGDDSESLI